MEKITRRKFFKSSAFALVTIPVLAKTMGLFNKAYAFARNDDATVAGKKQGYAHEKSKIPPENMATFDKHTVKVTDYLKEIKKESSSVAPHCSSCMQFKKDEADGYGTCAMVVAMGKKDGDFVYKDGWCKVWTISKERINKLVGA